MKKLKLEEFKIRAKEIHGDKYSYHLIEEYKGCDTKLPIYCIKHDYIFYQTPYKHINRKQGCPKCHGLHKTTEDFIKEAKDIHDDCEYDKTIYIDSEIKVEIKCTNELDHGYFWQLPGAHLRGQGCPKCRNNKIRLGHTLSFEYFLMKAKELYGDRFNYELSEDYYINSTNNIPIKCQEHGIFWQTPFNHTHGHKCPRCSFENMNKDKYEEYALIFFRKAKEIHGDDFEYISEYVNQNVKVKMRCNKCEKIFKQLPTNHLAGNGCPYCKKSKGEKELVKLLDKYEIKYKPQFRFDDCRGTKYTLPFDFYLPQYNICIEFQGQQHYQPVKFGGISESRASKNFEKTQQSDTIKKQFCINTNKGFLELTYTDLKENIIEEKLINFLNLKGEVK
jgi:phage FluMu protein Com